MKNSKIKIGGITLISLVVTIIVLIILATVSVNIVFGEDGLIAQAEMARDLYENSSVADEEALQELLNEYESAIVVSTSEDIITAQDIVENPNELLGVIVNYNTGTEFATDVIWRTFYADSSNIYIIAADYVLSEYAPETSSGYSPVYDGYSYNLYLYNIYSDYTGSASWDSRVSYWNTLYLSSYPSSTYNNAKAVAYLLDTDLWSDFTNPNYAEYTIGSPTLEMWVASWNQHGYTTLYCDTINQYGYYIGGSSSASNTYLYITSDYIEYSGYEDTLYFQTTESTAPDGSTCYGYWLATPSAYYSNRLNAIIVEGTINSSIYSDAYRGFRPVVCLSSGVSLTLEKDGTYSIN